MATPYLQIFPGVVPSTQDLARAKLEDLPVAVIAPGQSEGRGRSGATWENAERALAVSVAWHAGDPDGRPFSLMAGVAAVRALDTDVGLKWPNDVVRDDSKVGGILVEILGEVVVAGLGLNLFWRDPPDGMGTVYEEEAFGDDRYKEVGALWVAEFMALVDQPGWPIDEYRSRCLTLGREISWEPDGEGTAVDVADDGSLIVETGAGTESIHAGAVRHIR